MKTKIYSPANTEELRIPFKADKTAKVVGKLAQLPPPKSLDPDDGQLITGVLVQNDFKMTLMAAEDLREYAGLTTTTITCKQRITLSAAGINLIKWALEGTFGTIDEIEPKGKLLGNGTEQTNGNGTQHGDARSDHEFNQSSQPTTYLVMGCVTVRHENNREVTLEWEGSMMNDGIADAVMAVLLNVESSPAAVKRMYCPTSTLIAMLKDNQSHRGSTITNIPNVIHMLTSHRKNAFPGYVCFSKHNSGPI